MLFRQLFDPETSTYTYLLADEITRDAILIDPVLDQIERDAALIQELDLALGYALDTHVHADHVTALGALRDRLGARTVISARAGVGCADLRVVHGDIVRFGNYGVEVRETPGHTAGCVSYVTLGRAMAFTGDALLIRGCGRTDFQGGDAETLYRSVHDHLFTLPGDTLLYPGHDYRGRTVTSVAEERRHNPRLGGDRSAAEFTEIMRSLALPCPRSMDVALPRNTRCGMASVTGEPTADPPRAPVLPPIGPPIGPPIVLSTTGVPEVAPEWVAAHGADIRLVDVREPAELTGELGHIAGIEPVPLGALPGPLTAGPRDRALVFVCRSGKRSGQAALLASTLGFAQVASMRGGMIAWNERSYPVAR